MFIHAICDKIRCSTHCLSVHLYFYLNQKLRIGTLFNATDIKMFLTEKRMGPYTTVILVKVNIII